jgi:hypothetical protein
MRPAGWSAAITRPALGIPVESRPENILAVGEAADECDLL